MIHAATTGVRPAVSVVLPCGDAAATVERAIASIASQDVAPVEVVAVDDGSRDGTADLLAALAGRSWPFLLRIVTLGANRGPGDARNAGLDHVAAASDYVAFLDADDVWLPWKLVRQIAWMEAHPGCGWTAHRCGVVGRGPAAVRPMGEPVASPITRRGLLLRNSVATPAVVVRHDIVGRFRTGWRQCEDLMLWLDWLDGGHAGCMLEETLACLGRPPCAPGGSTGDRAAMYAGERRVIRTLAHERRIGRGAALLWDGYAGLRYVRRLFR